MKGLIFGAVVGALALAGCQTTGAVATRDSSVVRGQAQELSTQNPSSLEGGLSVPGTVTQDYRDMLIVRGQDGVDRHLRIGSQTRYFQDGKQVRREFLAPGSSVRASFDYNNRETIARDIHILSSETADAPMQLPTRTGAPTP